MKKLWLFILILTLMLGLFASCKGDDTPPDGSTDDAERSEMFAEQIITLPNGWEPVNFPEITHQDGIISVEVWRKTGELDSHGYDTYENAVARIATDGTVLSVGTTSYADSAAETDVQNAEYEPRNGGKIARTYPLDDETVMVYETLYTEYEVNVYLHHYDKKGKHLMTCQPAENIGYDISRDLVGAVAGDVFEIRDVVSVIVGEETVYLTLTSEGMYAADAAGGVLWTIKGSKVPTAVFPVGDDLLCLSKNNKGEQSLQVLDIAEGKLGDTVELPADILVNDGIDTPVMMVADGHDLYIENNRGIFGIDFSKDASGTYIADSVRVVDWVLSNIAPSEIYGRCMVDAETVVLSTRERMIDYFDESNVLSIHRMIPKSEIVPKKEIVLAVLSNYFNGQYAIRDFNKNSEEYRIILRDYSQYEYGETRKRAFDTDIAAGKIPDMIVMATHASSHDTLVSTYERSPLLTDLTPLLRADDDFAYDDLLGYVTKPYQWSGERQYLFPLGLNCNIVFGHKEDFPDCPVTADEFLDIVASWDSPTAAGGNVFGYVRDNAVQDCVDEENASCSFDDGYFAALYDKASTIPYDSSLLDTSLGMAELYRTGVTRLYKSSANNLATLREYVMMKTALGGDAAPVGYPNRDGTLSQGNTLTDYFAITENSEYKAVCVDFLQLLLGTNERRLYNLISSNTGFTYYHSDIDAQLDAFVGKTLLLKNDGRLSEIVDETKLESADLSGIPFQITEEDAEEYRAILDSIEKRINGNTAYYTIFSEEYWSDDGKPFAEKLKLIQSKVSIYLSEQE